MTSDRTAPLEMRIRDPLSLRCTSACRQPAAIDSLTNDYSPVFTASASSAALIRKSELVEPLFIA
jgi:hypothetical protein